MLWADAIPGRRRRTHEVDPAAGADPDAEAAGPQEPDQLVHRLEGGVAVGHVEDRMPGLFEKVADIVLEFLLGGARQQGEGDVGEKLLAELADEVEVAREERCIGLLVGEVGVLGDDLPDPFDQIRPVDDRLLTDEGAVVVEDGDPLRRGHERIASIAGDLFEELEDRGLGGALVPARKRIDLG